MNTGVLQSAEKLFDGVKHRFQDQSRKDNKSRYIPTLDGWRALAILLVLAHHAGTAFYGEKQYYATSPTRYGTWGVPVFFALSGLLITKLLLEEFDRSGRISLRSFYIRRAFRILPPATVFVLSLAALGVLASRTEMAGALLFFRNYVPDSLGGLYTSHFWSLAVEEHFYLIWPGLLVLIGVRRGLPAAAAISVALALWMSADFHYHIYARLFPNANFQYRTDLRLDGLFCGCSMAFLLNRPASREWLRRYYSWWIWGLSAAAIVYCLKFEPYLAVFWISILIPCLMVGTTLHPDWAVSRFLDLAVVKWVGRISYSLYIWQQLFLVPSWEPKRFAALQHWPVNLLVVFVCATVSYYIVEKPMIRLGHKLAGRFRTPAKERDELAWPTVAVSADS